MLLNSCVISSQTSSGLPSSATLTQRGRMAVLHDEILGDLTTALSRLAPLFD